jgi:hypothetical protein
LCLCPLYALLESRATLAALDSVPGDFDTWRSVDKGKPVERRGRKATGLKDGSYDGGAASIARQRERSHSPFGIPSRARFACGRGLSGEFMTPTANLASAEADADHPAAPAAEAGPFVLNLCSSTTPMALAQTELAELKRFTFFVSRRFEEGRERFRLHMGFFASQAEAEEWLSVVRDIYPGAWAGEAPGKKLRARAAEAAAAQARHAVGPQRGPSAPAPAPPMRTPPPPPPTRTPPVAARRQSAQPAAPADVMRRVPTLHPPVPNARAAAPAAPRQPAAPVGRTAPPSARPPQPRAGIVPPAAQRPVAKAPPARPAAPPAAARPASPKPTPAAAARPASPAPTQAQQPAKKPIFAHSNVKEVMAALDTPAGDAADDSSLTDTQVLRFLESRREEGETSQVDPAAESGISLLKPDDTGTRRALKEAVTRDEPVFFAVQLQWSVQPVELDKVPPLAIFSAYTLYSVEGSRDGRKWYGLRLGFFNDVISAKQVAYYVRSEFASVAVVPVSAQERGRATDDNQRYTGANVPSKRRDSAENEFKLIDSDEAVPPAAAGRAHIAPQGVSARSPLKAGATASAGPSAPQPAMTRAARKAGGKVGARERRTPQTLEETLEILGANELAIDNRSGSENDSGVRHLRVEVQKNTPFSRLLERLSERVKKS